MMPCFQAKASATHVCFLRPLRPRCTHRVSCVYQLRDHTTLPLQTEVLPCASTETTVMMPCFQAKASATHMCFLRPCTCRVPCVCQLRPCSRPPTRCFTGGSEHNTRASTSTETEMMCCFMRVSTETPFRRKSDVLRRQQTGCMSMGALSFMPYRRKRSTIHLSASAPPEATFSDAYFDVKTEIARVVFHAEIRHTCLFRQNEHNHPCAHQLSPTQCVVCVCRDQKRARPIID